MSVIRCVQCGKEITQDPGRDGWVGPNGRYRCAAVAREYETRIPPYRYGHTPEDVFVRMVREYGDE